jgi:hypothetical protein
MLVLAGCIFRAVIGYGERLVGPAATGVRARVPQVPRDGYVGVMLVLVRPLIARLVRRQELKQALPRGATAAVLVALLASAFATEAIGIHAVFGAFLLGAVFPHDSLVARG